MQTTERLCLSVARDFSQTPGPRYIKEGPKSGEEFYRDVLLPAFEKALQKKIVLFIDLDDTAGYATSFLEESFGNLAINYGSSVVLNGIEIKSEDEAYLKDEIMKYINEAKPK